MDAQDSIGSHQTRVLIVVLAPLASEFGASQMAINLAEALRQEGMSVSLWTPHPLPRLRGFQVLSYMRRALEEFIDAHGPFDRIDAPAIAITRKVAKSGDVVARSIAPQIQYELSSIVPVSGATNLLRLVVHAAQAAYSIGCILLGWKRAERILCLGTSEYQWMRTWCPWWRRKTAVYMNSLSETERVTLATVRRSRRERQNAPIRFLWIGRWARHKGTARLIRYVTARLQAHPGDTLTIAGCGRGAVKAVARIGTEQVRVIETFERSELGSILAEHDVGLFTSTVEGWGLCLNEMLESGMLVYATSAGGVVDLKPYFGEALRAFPPPVDGKIKMDVPPIDWCRYYCGFTWSRVARAYVQMTVGSKRR